MFDLKVKTLDGQTHEFSVPDDATVLQFKEIIAEKMGIAVDRQRLLYQGRVLVDESLLSSYEVAGNVMHLVTRLPPQSRPAVDPAVEREENSDINRDQIRNILSDVFNNIGDLNNPMGVSVNNEGNRMDITVNIPTQNRLSLSRLRQNYVMRLIDQATSLVNFMQDPSLTPPRSDRDRLRQADPYDIGPNDERLTEITSQPLPIGSLADMIGLTRTLWAAAEPQLIRWESVLRRELTADSTLRSDIEMQRIHDSASRYVHLFSHILHILSDYLVEFQPSNMTTRVPVPQTNVETSQVATTDAGTTVSVDEINSPLTNACGESGMAPPNETINASAAQPTEETTANAAGVPVDIADRSQYLYVFSEMPAQVVQVRLDVDSTIRDLGATTNVTTQPNLQPTRTTESSATTESTPTTAGANTDSANARTRSNRRNHSDNTAGNIFRTTLQDTILGTTNSRPQMSNGSRSNIRSTPQFMDNVDPYVRCQSRHFQHPSNLRSGAMISTFSNIRLRETSRPRATGTNGGQTTTTEPANGGTAPQAANVRSTSTDTDPVRSLISGLMNSIFPGPGDNPRQPVNVTGNFQVNRQTNVPLNLGTDVQRILQTFTVTGGSNLNAPLAQIFPEMLNNADLDPDNFVTNQIVQIVINRLTLADLMGIVRGQYTPLNQLRVPLQEILSNHQRDAGSRDVLIDHVVSDLEFFNRAYIAVFEKLRNGELTDRLSEEARNSFNIRLDIFQTINNLNRYHFQSMVDMIMRSPTNQGFGQLLMNSLTLHHNESLALIDIICNNNDELRQFLIKSFLDSLILSMNSGNTNQSTVGLDILFDDINSGLFRRPDQLAELREHTLTNFAVFYSENGNAATSSGTDEPLGNTDSIEEMVTNLSENIINGTIITELVRPSIVEGDDNMDIGAPGQGEGPMRGVTSNGGGGQDWRVTMPLEWVDIIARDAQEAHVTSVPYSDPYVAAMPPKRRKVIVNQRSVQRPTEMMTECIDQAIKSAGLTGAMVSSDESPHGPTLPGLDSAFQDMVTDRVRRRLTDERPNFVPDRFPTAEHKFFTKKKRSEDEEHSI